MVNYNRFRRPALSPQDAITIKLKLRLSQIIDLHEIDQIMTCSVWMKQVWFDQKLSWNPQNYGGVSVLYVPYEMLWVPDIVLYNAADLEYNITISTKATLHYSGEVTWEPPAIFKPSCQINVQYFPFDEQICVLKFGSWSFPTNLLRIEPLDDEVHIEERLNEKGMLENMSTVDHGIDLSDYYPSVEWDIMTRRAYLQERTYVARIPEGSKYADITYELVLRRKPMFYTVNLVFPCVAISFLTVLVFYLPSDSGEKVSLCIQILVALTLFILLTMEIIPAKSTTIPLICKYLLFTMLMVTSSVMITIFSQNLHFRSPTTHKMPWLIRTVFLEILPKVLFMPRPLGVDEESYRMVDHTTRPSTSRQEVVLHYHDRRISRDLTRSLAQASSSPNIDQIYKTPQARKAFENVCFISELLKKKDKDDKIEEDWKYVAMVLDRVLLIVFFLACVIVTCIILCEAPTLFDNAVPIDLQYRPASFNVVAPPLGHNHVH
uniref:Neur_chan_LBD domain-containing protein n=1 Tax=Panagrellus redivivus TaxID=6233 RepID=A0A7E4UWC0_PANRE